MCNFARLSPLAARPSIEGLSNPEIATLKAAAKGKSNEEIATATHKAVSTVKTHLRNAATKLGVDGTRRPTTAAVFEARERGYL